MPPPIRRLPRSQLLGERLLHCRAFRRSGSCIIAGAEILSALCAQCALALMTEIACLLVSFATLVLAGLLCVWDAINH